MQIAGIKICPSCGHSNSATGILCNYCGKQVNPDHYKIFRDGAKFGVALEGKTVFHDLTLTKAQNLADALNGDTEKIEAGVA